MLIIISSAFLAGLFTKYLDYRAELGKENFYTWVLVFLSSGLIAYLTYIFPDVMMGVILGVVIAGKTSNKMQIFNFLIPLSAFAYSIYSGNEPFLLLMGYTFLLSLMDEQDFPKFRGVRPMLPLGMIFVVAITSDLYITLATITLLSFDLGYIIGRKILEES